MTFLPVPFASAGFGGDKPSVPIAFNANQTPVSGEVVPTLGVNAGGLGVAYSYAADLAVRRLMPVECERLQGWPDNHTATGTGGTTIADSHRYRMTGNGISAPVAQWIAQQIDRTEATQ